MLRYGVIVFMSSLASLVIVSAIILMTWSPGVLPEEGENSISTTEYVHLSGSPQFVSVRGNKDAPLLLFLHGGPGDPIAPHISHYNPLLQHNFLVVHWDQRGAGRSFHSQIPPESMTAEQVLQDARDLISLLQKRFPNKPLVVIGHSWGTYLGLRLADENPELMCAYIGIGQVANQPLSEVLSYDWVLKHAEKYNLAALSDLKSIGAPTQGYYRDGFAGLLRQRKWVREFGGAAYDKNNFQVLWLFAYPILRYPAYRIEDKLNYLNAEAFSMSYLLKYLLDDVLAERITRLRVPIIVMQGTHDKQTVTSVTRAYFDSLQAPYKRWVEFADAAHLVPFEKPNDFSQAVVREVGMVQQCQMLKSTG